MDAIVNAARWIEHLMLGPVATALAVVGIAFVGILMLQGRIDWRRGATVCMGCFLVFGARAAVDVAMAPQHEGEILPIRQQEAPSPAVTPVPPVSYDPYAGAALPN